MIPVPVPPAIEYPAFGDLRSTDEHPIYAERAVWSPISDEGRAMDVRLKAIVRKIESRHEFVVRQVAVLADVVVPESASSGNLLDFAQRLFPGSRNMTRAERKELDATFWSNIEPLDFAD